LRRLSYPLYLLESAPPSRLAEVVVRRIGRRLRAILPIDRPPGERAVLAAFGVDRPEDLVAAFARPVPGTWPFADPERLRRAAADARRWQPDEVERLRAEADDLAQGLVSVFGTTCVVAREDRRVREARPGWKAVDWERCPRTKKRAVAGICPPGVDPKDAWAVGRLDLAVRAALAALAAPEDPRAALWADTALDLCLDLVQAPRGLQWRSPMEVALRAANLAFTLRALAAGGHFEARPRALLLLLRAIEIHACFVAARLEDDLVVPNNHLLADVVGTMTAAALVPQLSRTRALALALAPRLRNLIRTQILDDGFGFEASTGYHRLAAELFLLGALASRALGISLAPDEEGRIRSALAASERLVDGCGEAPQIGDADSGQALPFRSRATRDHRHLPGLGRRLGGERGEGSWEALWLFGEPRPGPVRGRPRGDDAFPAAGIYLMRSHRMTVAVACGPNGTGGTGSHGHNDKLSLEICLDGRRLVVDPGSGRYTSDLALRNRMRGSFLHSTATVDGEEQQDFVPGRLFALPEQAHAHCLLWEPGAQRARFVGEHRGYLRLPEPVLHRRDLELRRDRDRLFVTDVFLGGGRHRVEVRYVLPVPRTGVRIRPATPREENELGRTLRWVVEVLQRDGPMGIVASAVAPGIEEGLYAEGYGRIHAATVLVFGRQGTLPMTVRTCVSPAIV